MDGPAFLDGLVGTLTGPLSGGYARLAPELQRLFEIIIGLNLILAALAWCGAYLEVFQRWISAMIPLFVWVMIFTSYPVLTTVFQEFCIEVGLLAGGVGSGGGLTVEEFQHPSTVMMKGFESTAQVNKFIQRHTGWAAVKNFWNLAMLSVGAVGLWLAFVVMAVHLIFVQVIMAIVVAFGFAFIIFGALGMTNFLAERAFGLIVASAARLGVTALFMGLAFSYLDQFNLGDPAVDPDMSVGAWVLVGAWFIAGCSIILPAIVHGFFAGGPKLGLSNLIPGAALLRRGGGGSTTITNNNIRPMQSLPAQGGHYL